MLYLSRFPGVSMTLCCAFKPRRHPIIVLLSIVAFIFGLHVAFPVQGKAQAANDPRMHPEGIQSPASSTFPKPSASTDVTQSRTATVPSADPSHYFISTGDVLDVSVFGAPDLSQKVAVNSNGDIYMPLVNYVHVAGKHVEDAQNALEQAYYEKGVLKFPHVSIVIATYSSGIVLMGEVSRPGIYPMIGDGRLFDILAEAGGATASAGQVVTITHKGGGQPRTVLLTNDPVKAQETNVSVQQGDTIVVSKAGVIYVVGEVLAPSGFLMDEKGQYTVMKAVAMAHGVTRFARTSTARIVRRTPTGQQEIPVPLNKILVSKAPDIPMQSNDILFIPSSTGKRAASRTADVAAALASGVAYYGFYR